MKSSKEQGHVRFILLGAGKPFQGEQHSVLRGATGRSRVLDWLLNAMGELAPDVHFVGGYQLDEVAECYPDLHYSVNPNWASTGAAASLLEAPLNDRDVHFVSFCDVLYRASAVSALNSVASDVAILVDRQWRSRFEGRSPEDLSRCEKVNLHGSRVTRLGRDLLPEMADAEFVGLMRLSPQVAGYIDRNRDSFPDPIRQGSLSQFVELLRMEGFSVEATDVAGDWAELNEPDDLSRFILGTKAQTLYRLQGMLNHSRIEDQVSFTVAEWDRNKDGILSNIHQRLADDDTLVVRSSALSEDGFGVSNAGAYTSVLNVDGRDKASLTAAIVEVIASYPDGHPDNQVLVQPMLRGVNASGVAFTRVLATGAPYYVINYDDTTSSTESITSGASREHKTLFLHRDAPDGHSAIPDNLVGLLPALREVEALLDFDSLDVEFAMTEQGGIHILQVRPIAVQHELASSDAAKVSVEQAVNRFEQRSTPGPFVVGDRPLFGIMPDWNPAEIIGTRPGRLAASLYRFLILDDVWAAQRAEYGYRDVRPQPLLTLFAGHPYIDVRASFNSFIPALLDNDLSTRLVNFYLQWLADRPQLHDKVEFDVVPTCYALDFEHWKHRLVNAGRFSDQDVSRLAEGLRGITKVAFQRTASDLETVDTLQERFAMFSRQPIPPLDKALALLEDCRRVGTLTFAHLARSGFVAITLLRSAVTMGVLSQSAVDDFLNSVRTVSHRFTEDAGRVARGDMAFDELVADYGHLRPGTYDIGSASYAEDADRYLRPVVDRALTTSSPHPDDSGAWIAERQDFLQALSDAGLPSTLEEVEAFLRGAIEGRERAKFEFTRYLSQALDCIADFAGSHGLSRDEIAHVPLEDLLACRAGDPGIADLAAWLKLRSQEGAEAARTTALIELPPLIKGRDDFYGFLYADSHANFIGSQRVLAECVDLRQFDGESGANDLSGCIALIPQADPGYDWLFGHNIAGLVTMYGGANSHMAIRAAEFGLSAAIGVGEARYVGLAGASVLELDPSNRRLEVVR